MFFNLFFSVRFRNIKQAQHIKVICKHIFYIMNGIAGFTHNQFTAEKLKIEFHARRTFKTVREIICGCARDIRTVF